MVFDLDQLCARLLAAFGRPAAKLACARRLALRGAHRAALPLLASAAKADLPVAWHELGRAYLLGLGVPSCPSEALHWLTKAAMAGEPAAQSLLASLALQGIVSAGPRRLFDASGLCCEPDYQQAKSWAQRAAAAGSAEAQALLGFLLTSGPEAMRDPERGEQLYQQAAAAENARGKLGCALALLRRGNAEATGEARTLLESAAAAGLITAHYLLALIAESGAGGEADFPLAAKYYRTGAEAGHGPSQLRYGLALLTGRGVQADPFEGESWLRRAGLAGEALAAAVVGNLYATPGQLPPNYAEAASWFRRAAEAGHAGSARALGRLLLSGAGVAADPEEAACWLRAAVAQGDAEARADLAGLSLARQVPEADRQATVAWFREGAASGDPAAACNLGICLAEGIGVPRDDSAALELFRSAADRVPIAQYWYGRMLAEGRGTPPDHEAARAWFLRAAENRHADAEVAAGEMLINGRGGAADPKRAMALFERAAATGHAGALFALQILRGPAASGDQRLGAAD